MTFPTVVIAEYDPRWPDLFESEREKILAALGDRIVAVEHTGSTAVPGLAAKPIIDIVGGVRGLAYATGACMEPLESIGYEFVLRPGLTDRRLFRRGAWLIGTMYHLHLVEYGEAVWERHLQFRDALRASPKVARRYEDLKRQLAAEYWADRAAYTTAKHRFVSEVVGPH